MLGKWIQDARNWGQTKQEKDLYEFNARDLVTLWGDKNSELHEYSNRQWSGLIKGFYKPRWEQFFNHARQCLKERKRIDMPAFEAKIKEWEWEWVNSTAEVYPAVAEGDPIAIADYLHKKYKRSIEDATTN
jgi:alpha-N-acetylglucosaminidase